MRSDIEILSEEHVFTSDEKLKHFGYGEWVEEVDLLRFLYCGYTCMVRRTALQEFDGSLFGGFLCGYVHIPQEHAVFGDDPAEIPVDCHWGITFCENDASNHLIGFDCGHSGDLIPSHSRFQKIMCTTMFPPPEGLEKHPWFNPTYKNISYCVDECCHLVDQLEVIQIAATAGSDDENL